MIGYMPMPEGFLYQREFLLGRPPLSYRHPRMDPGHRAKIFAPFDALLGFDEAICAKQVVYENRLELNEAQRDELNRRLLILQSLTANSRLARTNHVRIQVTFFVPCTDIHHAACGHQGRYETVTGICRCVDPISGTLTVNDLTIKFADILTLDAESDMLDQGNDVC